MIDWLTLKIDGMELEGVTVQKLKALSGRVMKIDADGQVEWETTARENVCSDSHQVSVCMGGELTLCGSPARVVQTSNVFGSGDVRDCASMMINFVAMHVGVDLPHFTKWRVTRIDVTHNYDLQTLANVRQALMCLRHAEGGRYQLRTAAESVYWSVQSRHRSAKAYAKGPHIQFQMKKGQCTLSPEEVELTERLLRLELSLRSMWWKQQATKQWHEYSESELDQIHAEYFGKLIGSVQVTEMRDVQQQVINAAIELGRTEGQGRAAFAYWCLIQAEGFQQAKDMTSRPTHFRHVGVLKAAGLSYSDFQARRVVALRRTPLVLSQPVRSFDQLRQVA